MTAAPREGVGARELQNAASEPARLAALRLEPAFPFAETCSALSPTAAPQVSYQKTEIDFLFKRGSVALFTFLVVIIREKRRNLAARGRKWWGGTA
jgi:hypothetical protein